jgi:histidyl-tRNA synthetase
MESQVITIKNMSSGEQEQVPAAELVNYIKNK